MKIKNKEPILQITFPNGRVFNVPASFIARDRATYYAKKDTGETSGTEYDEVYREEYEYTLKDSSELLDWVINNMNWDDLSPHADEVIKAQKQLSLQSMWSEAGVEVI